MKKKWDPALLAAVAARLNALMVAEGLRDADMARYFKLKPQTWNNYTQGNRPLPIDLALALVERFRITLDWVYRGERGLMPHALLLRIEQHYPSGVSPSVN